MKKILFTLAVGLISSNAFAKSQALEDLIQQEWQYNLAKQPLTATNHGVKTYNDRLADVSPASLAKKHQQYLEFLARLKQIPRNNFTEQEQINYQLMKWQLEGEIKDYELKSYRVPFNTFWSFYTAVSSTMPSTPMRTTKDYQDYIKRLADIPRYFSQHIANMEQGINDNFMLPKIVLEGIIPTVESQVYNSAKDNALFKPFNSFPKTIEKSQQQQLTAQAIAVIENKVHPAYQKLADFFKHQYLPKAPSKIGAYHMNNGKAYYAQQIRNYVTVTDLSAEQIHQIGLDEVARIRAEMMALIKKEKFDGSFNDFVQFLRTDKQFYATSKRDLLKEASYIAKRIDHKMPGYFKTLPRLPYGVVPVPDSIAPNYTTAAYWNAIKGGDTGGSYMLNTYGLDQRPLYELTALTLHEAVPGHHHQSAISSELENVPEFRKSLYFSAFGEGWALYTEKLGVEMGLYETAYDDFGRLSYEMWRASRLVLDTGIHAMGWERQQALDFLADNTSLSLANVRAEVDRYISWPGQALSYKLGEIKIWQLRHKAENALGEKFDIREFHDVILKNGALPLVMLEQLVNDYIQTTLTAV
ncbi:DUF885 domain-containing protein [Thalassotalea sp. PLHSN55]|uniref:DUF885 domain-containing protein n=1 Tax=Thalassotalea sp. PLHSN55 TaxID=3435888 RepID=UPI003F85AAFE